MAAVTSTTARLKRPNAPPPLFTSRVLRITVSWPSSSLTARKASRMSSARKVLICIGDPHDLERLQADLALYFIERKHRECEKPMLVHLPLLGTHRRRA